MPDGFSVVARRFMTSDARSTPGARSSRSSRTSEVGPQWLMQAQRAVTNSDEFNIICRDVVRHVEERNLADSFTELSDAEQQNLLDDVFAQLGASANQYEQCVESRVDACLSEAVMAARNVSTEESVVETVEKFASCGILSLLSSIPYENFLGAAQALVGRSVPSQLRAPLWTRRLGHLSAEESFHREQNADRLGTISVDDAAILAECKAILGKTTVGSLKPGDLEAMKISLSYRHARMLRERKQHLSFPHELYWLTLPLVLVFSALNQNDNHDDLARRVYVATQAVLEDGVGFVLESPSTGEDDNKKKILSDPALPREETTQKSQKAALPWDEAPVPSAPVRSKRSGETSALSLRLGIEQATAFSSETPRNETVPRQWAEHALQMLVSADPHFIRQLLDAAITPYVAASKDATAVVPSGCGYSDVDVDIFISLVGHLLRTGLVSVLPTAATLFLWDQCVLSSFRLCIPLGVATLLLALHKEVSELALDATRRDWHSNFIRLVSLSGRDVSPAKFERLFQQHALPFVLASGTVRKPPQEMLSRPSPTLIRNVLQTSASHIQRFRPEKSSLTIAEGGIFRPHADLVIEPSGIHEYMENLPAQNFTWSAVCPAEDTLASIVDKVIDESQNIQAMNYIRHAWSQRKIEVNATSDSDPNVTVRRNLAVRVLRSLPCFAALYESFPRAIATEISTILNDAIKVDLPVDAAETTASRVLGEEPVMVTVILPSSNHNREELAKPRGESLQCAVVVALRASKCALWPHLRQNVLKLSDAAYEMYRKQRELRGIALVTMSHRKEGEEAAAAKDVLRRHGAAAIGDDFYEKSGSNEQPYRESNESQIANLSLDSELMVAQAVADVERSSEQSIIETDAIATPKESRYLDSTASNDAKTSDEVQINAAQNIHQQAIARAIAETQTKVFQRSYTKEELALMTPKERKVYSKKYTKWTKAFRSRWKSDSELRAAVPTLETVETLLTSWAPSSGH